MKRYLILAILTIQTVAGFAQSDRQYIRYGNRQFKQENYVKAEAEYRKALDVNPQNPQALYNLGCALMMQKKDSAAVRQFEAAGKIETEAKRKAMVYHNIGWICQSNKLFGEAVEAYKESLRNNPSDNETRYNLALCKRQMKKQQDKDKQKQQQKQQQKKEEQDKDKNKQTEDKKKEKQQQQEQQKQQEKMSKENAEQMLNAAMQQEQQTQQRMKNAMRQSKSRKLQKNW